MTTQDFRDFLLPADDPRLTAIRGLDVRQYAEFATSDPFAGPMITGWAQLYPEPFRGITTGGIVETGLFPQPVAPDEAAPTDAMVVAAQALLSTLDSAARERIGYPMDAHEWRSWANPEFLQHDTGLRLDEVGAEIRDAALALVAATLSPEGFRLARTAMTINGYLGDIVGVPKLMNEFSYNFALYGTPSLTDPWGWQLFGHHLALNVVVAGPAMVATPVFLGAEPNTTDPDDDPAGPFRRRIDLARAVMAALPAELRHRAVIFEQMVDPAMPAGRLHPGDERTLAGCFQDNRVIPFEGITVTKMPAAAAGITYALIEDALGYLPAGPRMARMREIAAHLDRTYFSWIGGWADGDPFYFRIQSPVVLLELDHHCGVFLSNTEPAAFHIHTIVRTPNGGDYGRAHGFR